MLRQRFQVMRIIHIALALGPCFLLIVVQLQIYLETNIVQDLPIMMAIVPAVALSAIAATQMIVRNMRNRLPRGEGVTGAEAARELLGSAMPHYHTMKIIQWAGIEGPAMLSGVAYFLTADVIYAAVALFLIILLVYFRPTMAEMGRWCGVRDTVMLSISDSS